MPGSFQAVHDASKSFLQSFTEAVRNELKDTEVTLTTTQVPERRIDLAAAGSASRDPTAAASSTTPRWAASS